MAIKYYKMLDLMNRQAIGKEELRKKIQVSPATMAKISKNEYVSLEVINKVCRVLNCQPGDLMEYVPDNQQPSKNEEKNLNCSSIHRNSSHYKN